MLWDLFRVFMKIGFVSFGGGYAMIPVIEREVVHRGWMSAQDFAHIISIAGMAPGPVATNTATIVGYRTAGIPGAFVSSLGTLLPSLIIILVICMFLYRVQQLHIFESAFYGLRPIITGLVIYAGIHYGEVNGLVAWNWKTAGALVIFALSLLALTKLRMHPLLVILASGALGIIFYA